MASSTNAATCILPMVSCQFEHTMRAYQVAGPIRPLLVPCAALQRPRGQLGRRPANGCICLQAAAFNLLWQQDVSLIRGVLDCVLYIGYHISFGLVRIDASL
jgi:hypothetical protein